MNKLKSSPPPPPSLALNTHFFVEEHFWRAIFIKDEKTKRQPLACFQHTF